MLTLLAVAGLGLAALPLAAKLRDGGLPGEAARAAAASVAGLAFLLAALTLSRTETMALASLSFALVVALRATHSSFLRGVRTHRTEDGWAEISFLIAAVAAVGLGWGLMGSRWTAIVPIAFVAWGDSAAAVTRACVGERLRRVAPSLAMLGVCLAVATLYTPYELAAAAALGATAIERFPPVRSRILDDNFLVTGVALAVLGLGPLLSVG